MTAFRRRSRPWGTRLQGKTAYALAGLVLSLAGVRLLAQSILSAPVAKLADVTAEPPPGASPAVSREAGPANPAAVPWPVEVRPAAAAQELIGGGQAPRPFDLGGADDGRQPFPKIRLEVPGQQILFRLESEQELRERMRQEARHREQGKTLYFPPTSITLNRGERGMSRNWPLMPEVVEPVDMGFHRLYFMQINAERYGWDLGVLHPVISAGEFYFDVLTLPLQMASQPFRCWEYNSGWCLPGDPIPLLLYPPHPK